jgi:hypothetical protein
MFEVTFSLEIPRKIDEFARCVGSASGGNPPIGR